MNDNQDEVVDELCGVDAHLEMAYEDANGSALPEHFLHEEGEDIYAGTGFNDDPDDDYD